MQIVKTKTHTISNTLLPFFPIAAILWYEMLFTRGVFGKIYTTAFPHSVMSAIVYGAPVCILLYFFRGRLRGIIQSVILLLLMIIGCATYIWLAKDNDPVKQTFLATVTPYWNQLMNYMK